MSMQEFEAAFRRLADAFAAPGPLPAGGAAAVASVANGIGLGLKVVAISTAGRDDAAKQLAPVRRELEALRVAALPDFAADCAAFEELLEALRRPRDDAGREARVAAAWRRATAAPVALARRAADAERLLERCRSSAKASVAADLEAAIDLVRAGRKIAARNARDNAARLPPELARELLRPLGSDAEE